MPTNFDPDTPNPRPKWIAFLVIAVVFVVAIALANRQVDRTTGMAPDLKGASEKTVGISPEK